MASSDCQVFIHDSQRETALDESSYCRSSTTDRKLQNTCRYPAFQFVTTSDIPTDAGVSVCALLGSRNCMAAIRRTALEL